MKKPSLEQIVSSLEAASTPDELLKGVSAFSMFHRERIAFLWGPERERAYKKTLSDALKAAKPKKGKVKLRFKDDFKEREAHTYGDWAVVPMLGKNDQFSQVVHVPTGILVSPSDLNLTHREAKRFLGGMLVNMDLKAFAGYLEKMIPAKEAGKTAQAVASDDEREAAEKFRDLRDNRGVLNDGVPPNDFKIPKGYKPKLKTWEELEEADPEQINELTKKELLDIWRDRFGILAFQEPDSEMGKMLYKKLASVVMPDLSGQLDFVFKAHQAGIFYNTYVVIKNPKNLDKLYEQLYKASNLSAEDIKYRKGKNRDSEPEMINLTNALKGGSYHKPAVIQGYFPGAGTPLMVVISDGEIQTAINGGFLKLIESGIGKDYRIKIKGPKEPVLFFQNGEGAAFTMPINVDAATRASFPSPDDDEVMSKLTLREETLKESVAEQAEANRGKMKNDDITEKADKDKENTPDFEGIDPDDDEQLVRLIKQRLAKEKDKAIEVPFEDLFKI